MNRTIQCNNVISSALDASINPPHSCRPVRNLVVIGCGHVVSHRIAKALRRLSAQDPGWSVNYVDLSNACPFELTSKETYVRADLHTGLPHSIRRSIGLRTAIIVACTTAFHCRYIWQSSSTGATIICEKPLCLEMVHAQALRKHVGQIQCADHFLWKESMQSFLSSVRSGRVPVNDIEEFEFNLLERKGTEGRTVDNAIFDLMWHGLTLALAVMRTTGNTGNARIRLTCRPTVGTYEPAGVEPWPEHFTAAQLDASLAIDNRELKIRGRVGKGMGCSLKTFIVIFKDRSRVSVDLDDADPVGAHERMLRAFLLGHKRVTPLSIEDNVEIVAACERACGQIVDAGLYTFGNTPPFVDPNCCEPMTELYLG